MSVQETAPPESPALDAVQDLLMQARAQNRQANDEIPPAVQIANLSQDAGYFKRIIYAAGILLLALVGVMWTAFLHLDNKIEHKMDYLNLRIDSSVLKKIDINSETLGGNTVKEKADNN